jgi:hypothetical protein
MYLRLNCTSRRASVFDVTRPKFALVGSTVVKPLDVVDPAMLLQFGWLRKLNISALNWIFCVLARRVLERRDVPLFPGFGARCAARCRRSPPRRGDAAGLVVVLIVARAARELTVSPDVGSPTTLYGGRNYRRRRGDVVRPHDRTACRF